MTDTQGVVVLSTDLKVEVVVPVVSRQGHRTPAALHAVATYLAPQPRYVKRDVDGKPGDETMCNFFVREGLLMLGVELPRMRANEFQAHLGTPAAATEGWAKVPRWVARALAELGHPVVPVQDNPTGPGHVALVQPPNNDDEREQALRLDSAWMCQAGAANFAHGLLMSGFRKDLPISFWAHP